jgi:hypothetical protein
MDLNPVNLLTSLWTTSDVSFQRTFKSAIELLRRCEHSLIDQNTSWPANSPHLQRTVERNVNHLRIRVIENARQSYTS